MLTLKICVSIPPRTITEAIELVDIAENQNADFIEIRLDSLRGSAQLIDIAQCSNIPMIATNRSVELMGEFPGSEIERQKRLFDAARSGFEYVDIELSTQGLEKITKDLRGLGAMPIISFHDFNETPEIPKLNNIMRKEIISGAEVCKIVTTATRIEDNLIVLDFISKACKTAKIVCFSMGELGKPSRLLSSLFGGFFTIASLVREKKTAPGQLTIQEMKSAYESLGLK